MYHLEGKTYQEISRDDRHADQQRRPDAEPRRASKLRDAAAAASSRTRKPAMHRRFQYPGPRRSIVPARPRAVRRVAHHDLVPKRIGLGTLGQRIDDRVVDDHGAQLFVERPHVVARLEQRPTESRRHRRRQTPPAPRLRRARGRDASGSVHTRASAAIVNSPVCRADRAGEDQGVGQHAAALESRHTTAAPEWPGPA